jgi:DinB superfamily
MGMATVRQHHPTLTADRDDPRWDEAVEEHRTALAAFLDAAEALDDDAWRSPWAPGKWTRAQVAEHLALTYEAALRELATGEAVRLRMTGWRQRVARWIVLPHILFHRTLPVRVRSPRETRPPEQVPARRAEVLRRVRDLGERCELELDRARRDGGGSLTHPYFGRLAPVKAMRFVAVHLEHHTRQIAPKE